MKILILEDNENTRIALAKIVKACASDCKVFSFANRADAYLCALENQIDLFLVDIILEPEKENDNSGVIFADSIREHTKYKLTPIIFITTLLGLESELLKRIHCYDYIEKPLGDGTIVKRHIEEVIEAIQLSGKMKQRQREYIPLRHDGIGYMIYVDEIICIVSKKGILHIHMTDDEIIIPNLSTKVLLGKIQHTTFLIPTYGIAINPSYIESVDFRNREVYLKGSEEIIPIGGRMFKKFREAYLTWKE